MSRFLSESWLVLAMSLVFALLLAGAEAAFGPRIEANRNEELQRAIRAVVPAPVEKPEKISLRVEKEEKIVFKCLGADGRLVGWALVDSDFGFQDKIKLVVGLSPDGDRITGLKVVENTETPGLGNKIEEPQWSDQWKGLDAARPVTVVKGPGSKENNEIQAITGATISSKAVAEIANDVISKVRPRLDELKVNPPAGPAEQADMADDNGSAAAQFKAGLWSDNPVLVQLLGMCPTLAITNSVENALVMGAAATFVVICSNLMTSLLRPLIRPHVRILIFTLTIATFVTLADRFLKAHVFEVSKQLGAFVPLIIVNCMIICRAEVCAIKSGPFKSFCDACGIGLGFTIALTILGVVRELLGSGSLLGRELLPPDTFDRWVIMVLPPGAFLTLGILIGVVNQIRLRRLPGGAA